VRSPPFKVQIGAHLHGNKQQQPRTQVTSPRIIIIIVVSGELTHRLCLRCDRDCVCFCIRVLLCCGSLLHALYAASVWFVLRFRQHFRKWKAQSPSCTQQDTYSTQSLSRRCVCVAHDRGTIVFMTQDRRCRSAEKQQARSAAQFVPRQSSCQDPWDAPLCIPFTVCIRSNSHAIRPTRFLFAPFCGRKQRKAFSG